MAADTGISRSTIWRLMHEDYPPPLVVISKVAAALEKELNRRIDLRDIVAENGTFLTKFCCDVVGCKGCLPETATDEWQHIKEVYKSIRPGEWVCSRYPKGFNHQGGVNA